MVAAKETTGKDWKFLRLNHDSRHWKVDRVLANHSLGSTASQGTSNIPFPWFLLSQCNRQARNQERSTIMCLAEEHFSWNLGSSLHPPVRSQIQSREGSKLNRHSLPLHLHPVSKICICQISPDELNAVKSAAQWLHHSI